MKQNSENQNSFIAEITLQLEEQRMKTMAIQTTLCAVISSLSNEQKKAALERLSKSFTELTEASPDLAKAIAEDMKYYFAYLLPSDKQH